MIGWLIALIVVVALGAGGWIGWGYLSKEHKEAKNLPIAAVDFSKVKSGKYQGAYEGGMYKWRANECIVTVTKSKVADIQLVSSPDPNAKKMYTNILYDRIIKAQSLQVDTISGATLTSRAYLKAVEKAVLQK
jgi:uncharacterized protein with FMN-binding domain